MPQLEALRHDLIATLRHVCNTFAGTSEFSLHGAPLFYDHAIYTNISCRDIFNRSTFFLHYPYVNIAIDLTFTVQKSNAMTSSAVVVSSVSQSAVYARSIMERLTMWDSPTDPLAPLTTEQKDSYLELASVANNRSLPIEVIIVVGIREPYINYSIDFQNGLTTGSFGILRKMTDLTVHL